MHFNGAIQAKNEKLRLLIKIQSILSAFGKFLATITIIIIILHIHLIWYLRQRVHKFRICRLFKANGTIDSLLFCFFLNCSSPTSDRFFKIQNTEGKRIKWKKKMIILIEFPWNWDYYVEFDLKQRVRGKKKNFKFQSSLRCARQFV